MVAKKTMITVALLLLGSSALAEAQNRYWQTIKTRELNTFDWNCSRKEAFPARTLRKVVRRAIPPEDRDQPYTHGNRAFKMRLIEQGPMVYFVPTICGATGNCTWRLYTINPVKYLGEINGQFLYTYVSQEGMPTIITYGHLSASEGVLYTYSANTGKYRKLRGEYAIDYGELHKRPMPRFLERAKRQCKDYGM
jgi:hypothetical protein